MILGKSSNLPMPHFPIYKMGIMMVTWASQVALVVKNPPANAGDIKDTDSIPGLGRFPEGGHGSPFQYPCLENSMSRAAWQAMVHRVAESDTTEVI